MANSDITLVRSNTLPLAVTLYEGGEQAPFLPGDRVTLAVKYSGYDDMPLIVKELDIDPADGRAKTVILPEDTARMKFSNLYKYDVLLVRGDGVARTIVPLSKFEVREAITEP